MITESRHLLVIRRQTRIETGLCTADHPCLARFGLDTDLAANLGRMQVVDESSEWR